MMRSARTLWRSADGAVAPTVALSLTALLAAGGIAFDYARLASLDTELQDAADQAALAAASQLDGQDGACVRAAAAASNLLLNRTRFANDSNADGAAVTVPITDVADCSGGERIKFYKSWDQVNDVPGDAADDDSNAKVVVVSVSPRQAVYALTPIVAVMRSGPVNAEAVASLGSAICKMPPLMICNPQETAGNTSFDPNAFTGDGLRLTAVSGGNGAWAPGNFGYLDTSITGINGAVNQLRAALGWNTPPGNCISADNIDTKPGATVTVTDAINTRFDIYQNNNTSCLSGGSCTASINSLKDVRRPANANSGNGCRFQNGGWQFDTSGTGYYGQNVPTAAQPVLPAATIPSAMGSPRDECHAISQNGNCTNGRIGDGNWDRDAYFRTNYVRSVASSGGAVGTRWTAAQWPINTGLSTTVPRLVDGKPNPAYASRYNVYLWEIANRDNLVDGVVVLGPRNPGATGNTLVSYGKPACSPAQGYGSGLVPDPNTPDRRRISIAVVNCLANNVRGNSVGVPVEEFIDVFLVEPSLNRARTSDGDLYAEIIEGVVAGANGSVANQVVRHDQPYLIK